MQKMENLSLSVQYSSKKNFLKALAYNKLSIALEKNLNSLFFIVKNGKKFFTSKFKAKLEPL